MRIIAVDVGNTCTHLGVRFGDKWILRIYLPTKGDPTKWIKFFVKAEADFAIISSVVPAVTPVWLKSLNQFVGDVYLLHYSDSWGIKVFYDRPDSLGTDRLANALFVADRIKRPSVIADIGTAITVDAIGPDGTFYGGSILPGLMSSFKSLTQDAAQLSFVDFTYLMNRLPARSTEGCVSGGLLKGTYHAILGIAKEMTDSIGWRKWKGLLTGGSSAPFYPLFEPLNWLFSPTLTLDGLLAAFKRLKRSEYED